MKVVCVGFVYALKTEGSFGFAACFSASLSFIVEQTLSLCFALVLHIVINYMAYAVWDSVWSV